jgi:16S rRNA (guanine527-N7)-methyltransferase
MAFKGQNHEGLIKSLQVSRETITSLNIYEALLLENNRKFNLISKSTENILKTRHILDSAQAIDFIDKSSKICADLGTGAGFPGIVLSILFKERKYPIRVDLYEKSPKKCQFLTQVVTKLDLDALVLEKNVLEQKNLEVGTIVARAFKPIQSIFKIVTKNFKNFKNLILFLGKNGKQTLLDASKVWDFEYKERKSVTSDDSFIINIKKIRKKI